MKFLSICTKLGFKFSSLMGISAPNILADGNQIQSPNGFFETIGIILAKTFEKLLVKGIETIVKLIYAILKWVLTAIDFLFVLIRQMIGLNTEFTDVESLTTSDLIFKFVFSQKVLDVIKAMIGFAVLLIILFSIFSIIKVEYNFIAHGGDNSKKQVLASALQSLFLMVFVPILFIGGVVLSNAIAKSLYMATAGGTDTSMGAHIFVTSSYDANMYRRYAENDLKIPITFNFKDIDESEDNVTGWGADGDVAALDEALKAFKSSNVWNRGYTTFLMFYMDTFLDMDQVDKLEWRQEGVGSINKPVHSSYNYTYDKNIYTCKAQYYVMADFLDRAIKQEQKVYIKTVEQVFENYKKLPTEIKEQINGSEFDIFDSKIIGMIDNKDDGEIGDYYLRLSYKNLDSVELIHKKGALSESDGAVFILTTEKTFEDKDGNVYSCYIPFSTTDAGTTYQDPSQPIVAKGLFTEEGYPTAIRQEDGAIKFYRDDLNIPTLLDLFPTISYERPEGTTEDLAVSLIKKGVSALTGVDVSQFIPYVYYSFDIFNLFSKETYDIVTLDDGYFRLDYNFSQDGIVISNLYDLMNINIVILVFASVIIIGMLLKIMFGVGHRVLDVTLLAIAYPAVLATYPIDGGSRFKGWVDNVIKKITSIYGVIIGLNIVLWFFPVIDGLDLFKEMDLSYFVGNWPAAQHLGANFLNFITELLFMLVAFTVIKKAPEIFESIMPTGSAGSKGVLADGEATVKKLVDLPVTAGKVISGRYFMEKGQELVDTAKSFIPGSAIISEIRERVELAKKDSSEFMKDMASDAAGVFNPGLGGAVHGVMEMTEGIQHLDGKQVSEGFGEAGLSYVDGMVNYATGGVVSNGVDLGLRNLKDKDAKEVAEDVVEDVVDTGKDVVEVGVDVGVNALGSYIQTDIVGDVAEFGVDAVGAVGEAVEVAGDAAETAEAVGEASVETAEAIAEGAEEATEAVAESAEDATEAIAEGAEDAVTESVESEIEKTEVEEIEDEVDEDLDAEADNADAEDDSGETESESGDEDSKKSKKKKKQRPKKKSKQKSQQKVINKHGHMNDQSSAQEAVEYAYNNGKFSIDAGTQFDIDELIKKLLADGATDSLIASKLKEIYDGQIKVDRGTLHSLKGFEEIVRVYHLRQKGLYDYPPKGRSIKVEEEKQPETEEKPETQVQASVVEEKKEQIKEVLSPEEYQRRKERREAIAYATAKGKKGVITDENFDEKVLPFVEVYREEYEQFLEHSLMDDSLSAKAQFYGITNNRAYTKGRSALKVSQKAQDKLEVAEKVNDKEAQKTYAAYIREHENEYLDYLVSEGLEDDTEFTRAKFIVSEQRKEENLPDGHEQKGKFSRDLRVARYVAHDRDVTNKHVHANRESYDAYLKQSGKQDGMYARAEFYVDDMAKAKPGDLINIRIQTNRAYSDGWKNAREQGKTLEEYKKSLLAPDDPDNK